jgi:2-C-methyl-D-erythritol 4-phosphate cytidylyltransferase
MSDMALASAIIVAGGSGYRMKTDIRKQYLRLGNLPIISRTILSIDACPVIKNIYLVIPKEDFLFCEESIAPLIQARSNIHLVSGGKNRQESVYNGLMAISETDGIVVIHDGVRPFVTVDQINSCIKVAEIYGACILGIPVSDTLKSSDGFGNVTKTLDRNLMWLVQTPQAFQIELIKKAHEFAVSKDFKGTDDASILEFMGNPVKIVPGSIFNIKITNPEDLSMAQALIRIFDDEII